MNSLKLHAHFPFSKECIASFWKMLSRALSEHHGKMENNSPIYYYLQQTILVVQRVTLFYRRPWLLAQNRASAFSIKCRTAGEGRTRFMLLVEDFSCVSVLALFDWSDSLHSLQHAVFLVHCLPRTLPDSLTILVLHCPVQECNERGQEIRCLLSRNKFFHLTYSGYSQKSIISSILTVFSGS